MTKRDRLENEVTQNIIAELSKLPVVSFRRMVNYSAWPTWFQKVTEYIEVRKNEARLFVEQLREKQAQQNAQRNALIRPKIIEWAKKNLKPGMRVWVRGARDGIGYREVIKLLEYREGFNGRQLQLKWRPAKRPSGRWRPHGSAAKKKPEKYKWEYTNYCTDHFFDKLIAVDVDGKKTSIYDLI